MSEPIPTDLSLLARAFRQAMEKCESIYHTAALEYAHRYPEQVNRSSADFVGRMLDLHRGVVIKVFVEIAHVDWQWSANELRLAAQLFEHVWRQRLKDDQLRQALAHVLEKSHLRWESLLGPFERLGLLRRHAAELQATIIDMARLVAQADGRVESKKTRQLQWIQSELQRILQPVPLATPAPAPPPSAARVEQAAREVRSHYELGRSPAVGAETASGEEELAEALVELDGLIGLENIKQEVRELANFLQIQRERGKHGLVTSRLSLHGVFTGNPGTGKTTVARLLGRIFAALGILPKGHLIETDRSGLVAEYAGQTAPKTNRCVDEAIGGLLFIDEAYSLVAEAGDDPYGNEALQVLLKRMEDDRARLVVILAGYPQPMERLFKTNPGLSSRFPRVFHFPDYTAVELGRIFEALCGKNEYELAPAARARLLVGFQYLLDRRDERFGNGRLARNVFELAIRRLANRIARASPLTREMLVTLEPEDISFEEVPGEVWNNLDLQARSLRLTCPGCGQTSALALAVLGRQVQCRRCDREFRAEWGELLVLSGE